MIYGQLVREQIEIENNSITLEEYTELLEWCLENTSEDNDQFDLMTEGASSDYIKAYRNNKKNFKINLKEAKKAMKADNKEGAKSALSAAKK